MKRIAIALSTLLAVAACREEPSVAERFNSLKAEVENKGREYEAGAENEVAAQERRLADEANALLAENANLLDNGAAPVEVDVNSGSVELNVR